MRPKFVVTIEGHAGKGHGHRSFRAVRSMIEQSGLPATVREKAIAIFARLAAAEGKVHGKAPDEVTFHEVGAIDSIIDIVGAAWAVERLGIDELLVPPLPLGSGIIHAQHGPIPVPAPATVELLRGFETRLGDGEGELVTPTGAAIVAALGRPVSGPVPLVIDRIGYGAGDRELVDRPNLLRVVVGVVARAGRTDSLVVLEANVDDLNPEIWEWVMERLFAEGARDVFLVSTHMKKNRPGILVSVLADPERRDALTAVLFSETSTLGVRVQPVARLSMEREQRTVETRYGSVSVKIGLGANGERNVAPEYDDCRRLAAESGAPLKQIYQEAVRAALIE